jgi:hypothetical protein
MYFPRVGGRARRLQGYSGARGASPQSSIIRCSIGTLSSAGFNITETTDRCQPTGKFMRLLLKNRLTLAIRTRSPRWLPILPGRKLRWSQRLASLSTVV